MRIAATSARPTFAPGDGALSNRAARSGSGNVHGWQAVRVGSGIVTFVIGLAVFGIDALLSRQSAQWDFRWWAGVYAGAFAAVIGLGLLVHGLCDVRRMGRVSRLRAAHPNEPWRWDYAWDERGSYDDDVGRRARQFIAWGMGLLAMLAPMHWIGFAAFAHAPVYMRVLALPFGLIAAIFDLVAVGLIAGGVTLILRRLKYGRGTALFARFPFRAGDRLELHVRAPAALPQHAVVTATLRCVQERYVTRETSDRERHTNIQCFEVYRDTAAAELLDSALAGRALRVTFSIPTDAQTTDLASRPCRYWEVDVEARTDGLNYGARFLVPVY
jgi:hypothetical protein